MVRTLPYRNPSRLDFGRITAIAAAITVHVAALLLLLMPMAAPPDKIAVDRIPWRQFDKPVTPPPPLPPEIIKKKVDTQPKPAVTQPRNVPVTPTPDTAPVIDQGTIATADTTVTDTPTQDIGPPDTSPMVGSQLQYVTASPPPYPRAEQRSNVQGTVTLRVLVDVDGSPLEVSIEKSSGNRNLDRSASQHVLKHWRFQPAVRNGVAVQAYGLVPISFSLQ